MIAEYTNNTEENSMPRFPSWKRKESKYKKGRKIKKRKPNF
jgi:hypothetical protein